MTDPTGDGYDRYRPEQEQPTQPMEPVTEQPTQTMPVVSQEPGQVPYEGDGQESAGPDPGNGGMNPQHGVGKDKKKPWYKRTWVWVVAAVLLIIGLATGQGGSKDASAPASSSQTQPAVSQPAKETFDLQTLVGRKWDEASRTLTDHHWTTTDYTVQTDDGKTPILDSNWSVTGVSADVKPVISLRHDTAAQRAPAPAPAQSAAPAPAQEPTQEQAPAQTPAPAPAPDTYEYYQNCDAVRAAGKAPLYQGQPGYRPALDRDHDGVACE